MNGKLIKVSKRLLLSLAVLVPVALLLFALLLNDRKRPLSVAELPTAAQEFLSLHGNANQVAYATVETDWFDKEYKVVFVDGSKVEFNRRGHWKEIEYKYGRVPDAMIPGEIRTRLTELYGHCEVIEIERDRREYEVKLSNHLEVTFDRSFRIIDIDD